MSLPEQIAVRYAEDDAGYLTMRPVVKQSFRPAELTDMVVSVVGKDAARVQQILRTGTVLYHGYRYWWDGLSTETAEIEGLLTAFPDDDPSRPFEPSKVSTILFESGGGTQRNLVEIDAKEAGEKKLFGKTSAWNVLMEFAARHPPHYEKYSYARHADMFRVTLPFDLAQQLLASMQEAAKRALRHRWSTLRPPAALTFVLPREQPVT